MKPLTGILLAANIVVVAAIVAVVAWPDRPGRTETSSSILWSDRFAPGAGADPTCPDCNLLMVSLDIFRPDHMPCLGYNRDTTPNLCAMVAHGTTFDRFVVHAYQTPISQMSIFTGRYPSSTGFVSFASRLSPDIQTLPQTLQSRGYETVAMGSSFEVMTDMSSYQTGRLRFNREGLNPGMSFERGFDRFVFTGNRNLPTDAIPWLQAQRDTRFFLWLVLGTLHWPYGARGDPALAGMFDPPGYHGPLADADQLGFEQLSRIYMGKIYNDRSGEMRPLTADDLAFIRARYDFGLWTVDRFLGELLAAIPPDVLQKTLIVLHGIHGEDLGEHGYFGHYDIFDTEVRNALIVLDPRHRVEGVQVHDQVEGVDLAPTLLDLLGLPPLPSPDGTSFADAIRTGEGDPDALAFSERIPLWEDIFRHRTQMPEEYVGPITALLDANLAGDTGLRTERWKLLHRRARHLEEQVSWWTYLTGDLVLRPEWELYDLAADPTEQRDVLAEHPEVAPLQSQLLDWEARMAVRQADAVKGGWGDPRLTSPGSPPPAKGP